MKFSRTLKLVATLSLGLGPVTAYPQVQEYYYSGPVSGFAEVALSPEGFGNGAVGADFGTITETLYYDPTAGTLEQVGSFTVNPSSGSFNITSAPSLPPSESGTATLTVGNNGSVSFDTTFSGVPGRDLSGSFDIPVSGFGIYNGQAFAGSWNLVFELDARVNAVTSSSLTFSEVLGEGGIFQGCL